MCGLFFTNDSNYSNTDIYYKNAELLKHRGPDCTKQLIINNKYLCFHRLSVIGLSNSANQPFYDKNNNIALMCNGEIYNDELLRKNLKYNFKSKSDCEVIIPLYLKYGFKETLKMLDGEFAIVLYDINKNKIFAARDELGIRPLFIGEKISTKKTSKTKKEIRKSYFLASESKSLNNICGKVNQINPGFSYTIDNDNLESEAYNVLWENNKSIHNNKKEIFENINKLLTNAVEKRLRSDVPIGFLLSGGLDSSLVCSIASKISNNPIKTFSVGIVDDPIDTHYAKKVAKHINSDHSEYLFTKHEVLDHLKELIYYLESWDITTIRASLGMSLICKYIKENTNIKVIMTGEVSDELFGYKYTDYAPNPKEFQKESEKRISELCFYDVLRADRCISKYGLEARVPFSDKKFVKYVMNIDPRIKMNSYSIGKFLLRKSFENNYLPEIILNREKAAFSDAVGHSMVDYLKEYANLKISDSDLKKAKEKYNNNTPFTKESLLYRNIFEKLFPGRSNLIPTFWMPNKNWENCNVNDPSARILPNYSKSGK